MNYTIPWATVKRNIIVGVSILLLFQAFAVWIVPEQLPTVMDIYDRLIAVITEGGPRGNTGLYHLQRSLIRVAIMTIIGLAISIVFGIAMGVNASVEKGLAFWLPFFYTFPTVVVVLITMVVFRFSELSIILAVPFIGTPYGIAIIWEGAKDIDTDLIEMANSFEVSNLDMWRHVYLPSILPFVFGAFRYLLSSIWKVVVLAEAVGMSIGVGAMIRFWYQRADIAGLMAYLILFVAVMLLFQFGIAPIESRLTRWQRE